MISCIDNKIMNASNTTTHKLDKLFYEMFILNIIDVDPELWISWDHIGLGEPRTN